MNDLEKEVLAYNKGYRVLPDGSVLSHKNKNISPSVSMGYKKINVYINGKGLTVKVHRLQAYQKYKDDIFNPGIVVRHKDGDPLNNNINNILIGTRSENQMDIDSKIRTERAIKATSKTIKHDKDKIIAFYNKCHSYKETRIEFNISNSSTLHYILTKRQT